jgi:hypothetical protein
MRLASHPHWLIHVQIIKDCNLIFTCFQCWSSSCFLSSSCLHFCNFTLHLQIATFCNFTHLIFNLFHLKIHWSWCNLKLHSLYSSSLFINTSSTHFTRLIFDLRYRIFKSFVSISLHIAFNYIYQPSTLPSDWHPWAWGGSLFRS